MSGSQPASTAAQVEAILEAAAAVQAKGTKVLPEIMVPLVSYARELELQKQVIDETAAGVRKKLGLKKSQLKYTVGTMIEIPRAAITADKVAEHAEFFSFGTNDLTQTGQARLGGDLDDEHVLGPVENVGNLWDTELVGGHACNLQVTTSFGRDLSNSLESWTMRTAGGGRKLAVNLWPSSG